MIVFLFQYLSPSDRDSTLSMDDAKLVPIKNGVGETPQFIVWIQNIVVGSQEAKVGIKVWDAEPYKIDR